MDLEFRQCESIDLQYVIGMYAQATEALHARGIMQWQVGEYPDAEMLANDIACGNMYKLLYDGAIAGIVVINAEFEDEYADADFKITGGRIAGFHRLCVPVDMQGKGFGYKLMVHAEGMARTLGYTSVRLDTHVDNTPANAIYRRLCYSFAGNIRYSKPYLYNCYEKRL